MTPRPTLWILLLLSAACRPSAPAPAPASSTGAAVPKGRIALLLPESRTARYESHDLPLFKARVLALGLPEADFIHANANQDVALQRQQVEAALVNGARVLVLDPVDSEAAGALADLAAARGARVLAYDRIIRNSASVDGYLSFDNERVGRLQGEALLSALGGRADATVVMVNGSPTDANAAQFKRGAHAALDGKVRVVREYDTPDWSPEKAQDQVQQALTSLGNKVDGVYAANDGTAGGAIAALKAAGVNPLPPVTGQDAELAAIQRILTGEQRMTVYKPIRPEAERAAELAWALLNQQPLPAEMSARRVDNGKAQVPSLLLEPRVVTRADIASTVVADGFWKAADVCTPVLVAACKDLNIR
jgi:D-xylose transport system substrate-binding protein